MKGSSLFDQKEDTLSFVLISSLEVCQEWGGRHGGTLEENLAKSQQEEPRYADQMHTDIQHHPGGTADHTNRSEPLSKNLNVRERSLDVVPREVYDIDSPHQQGRHDIDVAPEDDLCTTNMETNIDPISYNQVGDHKVMTWQLHSIKEKVEGK